MKIAIISNYTFTASLPDDLTAVHQYGSESMTAILAQAFARSHDVYFYAPVGSSRIGNFHPTKRTDGKYLPSDDLGDISLDGSKHDDLLSSEFVIDCTPWGNNIQQLALYNDYYKYLKYALGYKDYIHPNLEPRLQHHITHCNHFARLFEQAGHPNCQVAHFGISDFWSPDPNPLRAFDDITEKWQILPDQLKPKEYYLFPHRYNREKGSFDVIRLSKAFPDKTFVFSSAAVSPDHVQSLQELRREAPTNCKFVTIPQSPDREFYRRELYRNAIATLSPFHDLPDYHDSVSQDTTLYWKQDGLLVFGTIEELWLRYHQFGANSKFEIMTVKRDSRSPNPINGNPIICANNAEICFSPIRSVVYHGIKPVWMVTFHNGKRIEITKDHSLFYTNMYTKHFTAKRLDDLNRSTDLVVSVDNYQLDNDENNVYGDRLITFMGLWMADGCYYKHDKRLSGVNISTGNEAMVVDWLSEFITDYVPMVTCSRNSGRLTRSNNGDVSIVRSALADTIFDKFGDVDSYTKRVPKFIFTLSNRQICLFLRGYFTGDGCVYKHRDTCEITCSSVNRPMIEDISVLLHRLGIKHVISSPQKCGIKSFKPNNIYYKLSLSDELSKERFINDIGFIKEFKFMKKDGRKNKLRSISLRGVRSIEFIGDKPVYDVSVPETEAFIANGILCHNTGGILSMESIKTNTPIVVTRSPGSDEIFGHQEDRGAVFIDGYESLKMAIKYVDFLSMKPVEWYWTIDRYISEYEQAIKQYE